MHVYVKGTKIRLDPAQSIGKGGEADVFDIGGGRALKLFKPPEHPDYQGLPHAQQAARERIAEHQQKLPSFPHGLSPRIIAPEELATDRRGGKIVGYTMRFLSGAEVLMCYADRMFRQAGVPNETVTAIFRDLHNTVSATHKSGVVIGDFNDLNVLVLAVGNKAEAYLIDADSFQFGRFLSHVFTDRFVDPLLCDPAANSPMLVRPHAEDSDWYAYAVMLMECLLFVSPYGGVYRPKNSSQRIPHAARPLRRITVFHPDVRYPKPAVPYGVLPDELLHHLHRVFEEDQRGVFPLTLLEQLRWTKCVVCGTEHARNLCPHCAHAAPSAVKQVTVIRGKVTATRIFRTHGLILFAAHQGNELRYLYHENDQFKREDGSIVAHGGLDPHLRFRLRGKETLMAKSGQVLAFSAGQPMERLAVDSFGTLPVFDANERNRYWIHGGQLMRDGYIGSEYIGDVLSGQTLFWVGPTFGFGFYRASHLSVAFVFDAERRGINDRVKLPPIRGQVVDATCFFSKDRCWFFLATREDSRTIHQCIVIRPDGSVEGIAQAQQGDSSWLGTLRGKCASGDFLLAATDEGIVRVELDGGRIVKTREFPDTEPFVDTSCHLLPAPQGLYVVGRQEIQMMKMT